MNIQYIQKLLSRHNEVKIIGKTAEITGAIFHVIGIVRYESHLRLLTLQYDEEFSRLMEESETVEFNGLSETVRTNRQCLRGDGRIEPANIAVNKVKIGNMQFDVESTEVTRCDVRNWEIMTMLIELLRLGWQPDSIDYQNIDNLFLTVIELAGEFALIPDLGENPILQVELHPRNTSCLVEQSVTLSIAAKYPDKLWFCNKKTGEKHWIQINRVCLCNMWEEAQNIFNSPHFQERLSQDELDKAKADFESHISAICPEGMCYPLVEYECEEDITLQFYSKAWLDAEPLHNSSGMGFIIKPDNKSGVLGLPLKAALIQEPMPEDTEIIEAELFCYNKLIKNDDVIM